MKTAREIAARVWCDPEMGHVAMDLDAAEEIATILERVRRVQAMIHPVVFSKRMTDGKTKYQENHGKYRGLWHYGSHGSAECGADTPNMGLTTIKENVTCPTCRGWLPIIETKLGDLTPEQAQAAYDAAPEVPLSDERIQEIVTAATASPGPQTHEEARQFHEGFLSGATAYAAAIGHSTLKSDNPKLCDVFDAQGWRTIELYEKLAETVLVCEHGVKDGDWCEPCNKAVKVAAMEAESNG